jgi:hypothetical protein
MNFVEQTHSQHFLSVSAAAEKKARFCRRRQKSRRTAEKYCAAENAIAPNRWRLCCSTRNI